MTIPSYNSQFSPFSFSRVGYLQYFLYTTLERVHHKLLLLHQLRGLSHSDVCELSAGFAERPPEHGLNLERRAQAACRLLITFPTSPGKGAGQQMQDQASKGAIA